MLHGYDNQWLLVIGHIASLLILLNVQQPMVIGRWYSVMFLECPLEVPLGRLTHSHILLSAHPMEEMQCRIMEVDSIPLGAEGRS